MVLAAHRHDAGCINSLAALLTSCVAKLLLEPQGSYAAIHGRATAPDSTEAITADYLCEALLFTVIKSTYRSVCAVAVALAGQGGSATQHLKCGSGNFAACATHSRVCVLPVM